MNGQSLREVRITTWCALAAWTALVVLPGPGRADDGDEAPEKDPALTVEEAVDRALERTSLRNLREAEARAAEAEVKAARAWPNPGFSFDLEQPNPPGEDNVERESFFVLEQELPISGRLGLEVEAARQQADATEFQSEVRRLDVAAEVQRRFYELLRLQRGLDIREEWLERLKKSTSIVDKQVSSGEASTFDVLEMEREIGRARTEIDSIRAEFARKQREFAALIGMADRTSLRLDGKLRLDRKMVSTSKIPNMLNQRPDVRALRARARSARARSHAAGRQWVPEPALRGGYKLTNPPTESGAGDTFGGFLLGVSLPLPILAQGTSAKRSAEAERLRLTYRSNLLLKRARAKAFGLHREASKLRKTADQFRDEAVPRSRKLVETAESSYEKGEIGILELVEAHRGLLDDRLRALELDLKATLKRVAFERAIGASLSSSPK